MNIFKKVFIVIFLITFAGFLFSTPKSVPMFEVTALNGEKITLEKLRGKVVIVTFWATDCASCLKEIPLFTDLYSRFHAKGLDIIGISMYYDPPNHVVEFLKQNPLPYLITLDIDGKLGNTFGNVKVTPTTFLLNKNSEIVWQKIGLIELAELQSKIETFLKEK
jgi:peroxiredoxin